MKRLFRSALAISVLLALTGCYGVEGIISIGEDDGDGANVSINMAHVVDTGIFGGDDEDARTYISERYGNEWSRSPLPTTGIYASMVLSQDTRTPAVFSDVGGNVIELTRGTAEQRADGRPEYLLSMDFDLPEPLENTTFMNVGYVLEYPETWQIRVLSDGGAEVFRDQPGRATVGMFGPGLYEVLIIFFPPWEAPPVEADPEPQEPAEPAAPEEDLGGEEPPLAEQDSDSAGGLVDNRDLEAGAAESESTGVRDIVIEGALVEAVTEITRDGGMIEFEGTRLPARSLGGIIPAGATVEVLGVADTYLFVQEAEEESGMGLWILVGVLVLLLIGAVVMIVVVLRGRQNSTPSTS
ncbi:MAG: NfeD family protein [Pontimonas sp.]